MAGRSLANYQRPSNLFQRNFKAAEPIIISDESFSNR